ncbi:MAG TPA: glycoside hydrolase family 13 protein [candidate division Zixibacteria bacterium]|nr:glycoside hydrolase family 13 protein [candidate division Zixibacteria bacterium]
MSVHVPRWVKDAVFYQVFPDRFAKSDSVPKPSNIQPWGDPPTGRHYQGGDLIGLVERLDYLTDLGINALYLNPIFTSATNHRYHTHDYYQVDPLLGGDDALRRLIEESHRRGVRVILDGVFNHASRGFFQFSDILENGDASPWLEWFKVTGWPLSPYNHDKPANYESWWDMRQLPKFNTDNPEVQEFFFGVAEYWIDVFQVDGWRLDVPEDINAAGFWEKFRRRVKRVNPEAYLVGEIWHQAPDWLMGDKFDAVMNYPLAEAILAFLAGDRIPMGLPDAMEFRPFPRITAQEFGGRLRHLLALYDWEVTQVQLNILDSHDMPRLRSLVRDDIAAVKLALLLQMTLPGAPCIYYGDEIGIRGTENVDLPFSDTDARWAFPWHDRSLWDEKLLADYKAAVSLRNRYPQLRRGQFSEVYAGGYCYAFSRSIGKDALIVGLNAGESSAEIELNVGITSGAGSTPSVVFGPPDAIRSFSDERLTVEIPARTGVVLAPSD